MMIMMLCSFADRANCVVALWHCYRDDSCGSRLAAVVQSCAWDSALSTCDRTACLDALRKFFVYVRSDYTQRLALCSCDDEECRPIEHVLRPTCSLVEYPPPTCTDLLNRCLNDSDCR
jgi:hypothetical protein